MNLRNYKQRIMARNPDAVKEVKRDLAFQIGREVERNRIIRGYTQDSLASELDTKQSSISRLEKGAALPSLRFLQKIAYVLNMYVDCRLLPLEEATTDSRNTQRYFATLEQSPIGQFSLYGPILGRSADTLANV